VSVALVQIHSSGEHTSVRASDFQADPKAMLRPAPASASIPETTTPYNDLQKGGLLIGALPLRDGSTIDAEDIRTFRRGQIAPQKMPRYIRFVETFPITVTGKVQEFIMRQMIAKELEPPGIGCSDPQQRPCGDFPRGR
jgi:acyl-CoA synthetase (AMP-forming)/AMP-acid ligase II